MIDRDEAASTTGEGRERHRGRAWAGVRVRAALYGSILVKFEGLPMRECLEGANDELQPIIK